MGQADEGHRPHAWMIGRRFEIACEKLGLNKRRSKLTTDHFVKAEAKRTAVEFVFGALLAMTMRILARMERSEIRDVSSCELPRIALRSIRSLSRRSSMSTKSAPIPRFTGDHPRRQRHPRKHRVLRSARLYQGNSSHRRSRRVLRHRRHHARAFSVGPIGEGRHAARPAATADVSRNDARLELPVHRRSRRRAGFRNFQGASLLKPAIYRIWRLLRLFWRSRRPSLGGRGRARHRGRRRPAGASAGLGRG